MGVGFFAVTTDSSDFLNVTIKSLGHVVVNHKSDVTFVDAHAESNGGNDYLEFFFHPI